MIEGTDLANQRFLAIMHEYRRQQTDDPHPGVKDDIDPVQPPCVFGLVEKAVWMPDAA